MFDICMKYFVLINVVYDNYLNYLYKLEMFFIKYICIKAYLIKFCFEIYIILLLIITY